MKGYQKEIYRAAGDAAKQLTQGVAAERGGVVTFHPSFAYRGVRPCYVVFSTLEAAQAAIQDGAIIVAP